MSNRGFVFREGIVDINIIREYARKNKADFLDLRRIGFTNINQLDATLSRYLSIILKRPTRTRTTDFLEGNHKKKPFFAVLPHNFLSELSLFNKDRGLTMELTQKLISNETSCITLTSKIRVRN